MPSQREDMCNFAGSKNCRSSERVHAIHEEEQPYHYDSDSSILRVEVIEVNSIVGTNSNMVTVYIQESPVQLFVDSGCRKTLIPRHYYQPSMGKIVPSSTRFRPYGTQQHLTVLGQVSTTLMSDSGSKHDTTVYVIEGHQTEPLLGDTDAKALGILKIIPSGKIESPYTVSENLVTDNLKAAGININSKLDQAKPPSQDEQHRIETIL